MVSTSSSLSSTRGLGWFHGLLRGLLLPLSSSSSASSSSFAITLRVEVDTALQSLCAAALTRHYLNGPRGGGGSGNGSGARVFACLLSHHWRTCETQCYREAKHLAALLEGDLDVPTETFPYYLTDEHQAHTAHLRAIYAGWRARAVQDHAAEHATQLVVTVASEALVLRAAATGGTLTGAIETGKPMMVGGGDTLLRPRLRLSLLPEQWIEAAREIGVPDSTLDSWTALSRRRPSNVVPSSRPLVPIPPLSDAARHALFRLQDRVARVYFPSLREQATGLLARHVDLDRASGIAVLRTSREWFSSTSPAARMALDMLLMWVSGTMRVKAPSFSAGVLASLEGALANSTDLPLPRTFYFRDFDHLNQAVSFYPLHGKNKQQHTWIVYASRISTHLSDPQPLVPNGSPVLWNYLLGISWVDQHQHQHPMPVALYVMSILEFPLLRLPKEIFSSLSKIPQPMRRSIPVVVARRLSSSSSSSSPRTPTGPYEFVAAPTLYAIEALLFQKAGRRDRLRQFVLGHALLDDKLSLVANQLRTAPEPTVRLRLSLDIPLDHLVGRWWGVSSLEPSTATAPALAATKRQIVDHNVLIKPSHPLYRQLLLPELN